MELIDIQYTLYSIGYTVQPILYTKKPFRPKHWKLLPKQILEKVQLQREEIQAHFSQAFLKDGIEIEFYDPIRLNKKTSLRIKGFKDFKYGSKSRKG